MKYKQLNFVVTSVLLMLLMDCFVIPQAVDAAVPTIKPLPTPDLHSGEMNQTNQTNQFSYFDPPTLGGEQDDSIPFTALPQRAEKIPHAGGKNGYTIKVSKNLEAAYRAYLSGDGEQALHYIELEEQARKSGSMKHRKAKAWHLVFYKAKAMIMMGKAAGIDDTIEQAGKLEIKFTGSNLNSHALMGEALLFMGRNREAEAYLRQVIQAIGSWQLPTRYGWPPDAPRLVARSTAQMRAYTAMAALYLHKGEFQHALTWAREAERLYNNIYYVVLDPFYGRFVGTHLDMFYGRAMNYAHLAAALLATSDASSATGYFKLATDYFKAITYNYGMVYLQALKAYVYLNNGDLKRSEQFALAGSKQASAFGFQDMVWRIKTMLAKAYWQQHRFAEAEQTFRQAQQSVELVSGSLSNDRAKIKFGIGKEEITQYLILIDIKKHNYAQLFQDMEQGRARAFMDMLAQQRIAQTRTDHLFDDLRELDQQIRVARQKAHYSGHDSNASEQDAAEPTPATLMLKRAKLLDQLYQRDPELAALFSSRSAALAQVQQALKQGEVIAYSIAARADQPLSFLLIRRDRIKLISLHHHASDLAALLADLQRNIYKPKRRSSRLIHDLTQQLSAMLELNQWGNIKRLYVVPSGPVFFIPWGMLSTAYPVSRLPMGSWLLRSTTPIPNSAGVEVLGAPEFGGRFEPLPGAKDEVLAVSHIYAVTPLLGKGATEAALRKSMGTGVKILHLATHGLFDPDNPLHSGLILSDGKQAHRLTAEDLLAAPLPAQVVILSACETGIGRNVAGDDLLGLSRSFYLGGTSTLLTSLWPVEDKATALFMQVFHQYSAKTGDLGSAWLLARDRLMQQGFSAASYGAFVLGGVMQMDEPIQMQTK
ncbi:MAG: CHAT domain-containing protein [Mariprofundus sp.]|nr:CHAT domain-containing protein [Mariprofundus sp.]